MVRLITVGVDVRMEGALLNVRVRTAGVDELRLTPVLQPPSLVELLRVGTLVRTVGPASLPELRLPTCTVREETVRTVGLHAERPADGGEEGGTVRTTVRPPPWSFSVPRLVPESPDLPPVLVGTPRSSVGVERVPAVTPPGRSRPAPPVETTSPLGVPSVPPVEAGFGERVVTAGVVESWPPVSRRAGPSPASIPVARGTKPSTSEGARVITGAAAPGSADAT